MAYNKLDFRAIQNFKEYLRIPSVQPKINYSDCVLFLEKLAKDIGLEMLARHVDISQPVVIMTWRGREPQKPSLLLSSHMDVVPVFESMWTYPPFQAKQDNRGNIYARGAQDMKCVGIQYLEAIHRLKLLGYQPKRTVYITFTPDEEIGSLGMMKFVETDTFRKLNVGCELDEGVASTNDSFNVYYGERTSYKILVKCTGKGGHAGHLNDDTASEKMNYVISKFLERRAEEKNKLETNAELSLGDVTTINLTKINGGMHPSIVPAEIEVTFDCRVSLTTDHDLFENWVSSICKAAGDGVSVQFNDKKKKIEPTAIDEMNPWWVALKGQFDNMEMKVNTLIFPAATDARYLRAKGIPAFGFSPMNNTPIKLHDHDEFLNDKVFLKGIEIYMKIIPALADH